MHLQTQAVAGVDQLHQQRKAADRLGPPPDQLAAVMPEQLIQRPAGHRPVGEDAVHLLAVDQLPRFADRVLRSRNLAVQNVAQLGAAPDSGLIDRREFQWIK